MAQKGGADEKTKMKEQKTAAAQIKPTITKAFAEVKNKAKDDKKLPSVPPAAEKKVAEIVKKLSSGKCEKGHFDEFEKAVQDAVKNVTKVSKEVGKEVEKTFNKMVNDVKTKSKKVMEILT